MSEEGAFLRAICEQPDDDTPRLAFADWLAERGGAVNAAWANGIRAQVWLARGAADAAAAQQSKVFESGYGQDKLRERLGIPPAVALGWRRGFPDFASADFRALRAAWPQLAFRAPVRRLQVYGAPKDGAAEFATWPALALLTELEFGCAWSGPPNADAITALAGCEALRSLKVLKLLFADINEATAGLLLGSQHLAGLEVLRLDIDRFHPALSPATRDRLLARFGPDAFDESIPF